MSTVALTLNKNEVNAIERNVGTITVGSGKLVVVPQGSEPAVVSAGESYEVGDKPVTILAVEGTNYGAVYTDPTGTEAPILPRTVPATAIPAAEVVDRGDGPGEANTGSYESRTVDELHDLAKNRGIKGYYDLKKDELIAKLRGE